MRAGGNRKLRQWFEERGIPHNMQISSKYNLPDTTYYAERHKALVEGRPAPPVPPKRAQPINAAHDRGDPNGKERLVGETDEEYIARQTKLRDEAAERLRQKFGGGGMQGLGSDPNYVAGGGGADAGAGVVGAIGSLWGTVSKATRDTVQVVNEDLKRRELGKKVQAGWQTTVQATKHTIGNLTDEETVARARDSTVGGLLGCDAGTIHVAALCVRHAQNALSKDLDLIPPCCGCGCLAGQELAVDHDAGQVPLGHGV